MSKAYKHNSNLISAEELHLALPDVQREVMENWFHKNFQTPDEGNEIVMEGQYVFFNGGPYEPGMVLTDEFEGVVSEQLIRELAAHLVTDCVAEWSPREGTKFYDPDEEMFNDTPYAGFNIAVKAINSLLQVEVFVERRNYFYRLLYVNVITAIEAYLSDAFIRAVMDSPEKTRCYAEFALGVRGKNMPMIGNAWHRLEQVRKVYKNILNVDFPQERQEVEKSVRIRHLIVHKNGKPNKGNEIFIMREEVEHLVKIAETFVKSVEEQIAKE